MDLFLVYLILRFTKPHLKDTGQDLVLGKQVPFILLVQNYKLLKDTYKTTLANKSDKRRGLRAMAEANAFMYYKLREEGITSRTDENIGIEFMNLNLVVMATNSQVTTPLQSYCSSA